MKMLVPRCKQTIAKYFEISGFVSDELMLESCGGNDEDDLLPSELK